MPSSRLEVSSASDVVTISAGIATVVPDGDEQSGLLVYRADTALYEAKNSGRNRVCVSRSPRESAVEG